MIFTAVQQTQFSQAGPLAVDRRFVTLANSAPVYLWMSDTDSRCVYFNDQWLKFTGRTLEQETGYGWAEGVHHEDLQRCLDVYMENFSARTEFQMIYRLRRADGAYRWILDRGKPFFQPDGSFAGFIGSCVDVSEQILSEEKQKLYMAALERLNQAQTGFIAMLTHELKTPLTVIKEGVDIVLDGVDGALNDQQTETLTLVQKNILRLKTLLTNVLDFQKLESGYENLDMSPHDIGRLAAETAELVTIEMGKESLEFVREIPDEPVMADCDAERLKVVIFNLLDNAVKFTDAPGRVILRVCRHGDTARIEVEDTGVGIPENRQDEIFEMFSRSIEKTKWGSEGFGVGLAICRKIVDLHHGTLRVVSAPGKGSRFVVELPAA